MAIFVVLVVGGPVAGIFVVLGMAECERAGDEAEPTSSDHGADADAKPSALG